MGLRITANLQRTDYQVRFVEISERGKVGLETRGITPLPLEQALDGTEAVILALPDNRIAAVTAPIGTSLRASARTPRAAVLTLVGLVHVAARALVGGNAHPMWRRATSPGC